MYKLKVALLFVIIPFLGGCNAEIFGDSATFNERKIRNLFNNEWEVVRQGDYSFGDDPYNKFTYPISIATEESFLKYEHLL